jgi:outer membrane protein TolC
VYLPRLDVTAGVNRATRNNIFGLLLPSQAIAPLSGPVLPTADGTNIWGSSAGFLVSWEPFDFGLRSATVRVAEATQARAEARVLRSQLDVQTLTADTFLTLIAAQETAKAAQAAVDRARVLVDIVGALVRQQLRPGVELSRAQAEEAAARTLLIRAQQSEAEATATLGQLLGLDPAQIAVDTGRLVDLPPDLLPLSSPVTKNPMMAEQQAAIDEAEARVQAANRSYVPRVTLQGATTMRGSGALPSGATLDGLNGLNPTVPNWAIGATVTFPVFDLAAIRARQALQTANLQTEHDQYNQILTELTGRLNRAKAQLEGARALAQNAPIQVAAAEAGTRQATARYQAGLGTLVDVADAQRLLTEAEIDDRLAKLGVWRAKLTLAATQGDVGPFLDEVSR